MSRAAATITTVSSSACSRAFVLSARGGANIFHKGFNSVLVSPNRCFFFLFFPQNKQSKNSEKQSRVRHQCLVTSVAILELVVDFWGGGGIVVVF